MMKPYTAIELFAGAGGLALGLEQAGFEVIGLVEKNRDAAETLKYNRPNWNVLCTDIQDISESDLEERFSIKKGELTLLSGGAPCQSFSTIGKRLGLDDVRGTMFYHYGTFLRKLSPKAFVFENVKGLRNHDHKRTYSTMLNIFEDCGYTITQQVLNAWDYGAAQRRERFITIGIRNDLLPKCTYSFPAPYAYKPVIRDIKLDINPPATECARYSTIKQQLFEMVPAGGCWKDLPEEIVKPYMKLCWYMPGGKTGILRRFSLDEPCFTVMTTPSSKQTDRCHPIETRPFSYRENARLQTFPDDWEFCGSLSSKYRQVGNAVPVSLAREIGMSIIDALEKEG